MPELTQQEKLQPALLDRLTDDDPQNTKESRQKRVLSMTRLREAVRRDLSWLLNTANLESTDNLDEYPETISSVLNFGIPDLTGLTASGVDPAEIERLVRDAIRHFEPRILPETLQVRARLDPREMSHNAMSFEIQGELWAQPVPMRLFMRTALDLETGDVTVSDLGGG